MTNTLSPQSVTDHPLQPFIERLLNAEALLPDTETNVLEVVGILKSYGVVLDAYAVNLKYIANHQFLLLFPFFKYFNGDITLNKLLKHWWHDRINYEYAEYCMRTMLWHGGGGLDAYLDSDEFQQNCERAIQAKLKGNWFMQSLHRLFPDFLPEQVRQSAYYSALGQFWTVMSEMFLTLSDLYDHQRITSIPEVVAHIKAGLVAAASLPITYSVEIRGDRYDLLPESAGLTFLMDTAVPYVEAVFFRGTPFLGTVSYNAQVQQISPDQSALPMERSTLIRFPWGARGFPPPC
jgi:CO2 hydration protein